jgi:hypothetical protein
MVDTPSTLSNASNSRSASLNEGPATAKLDVFVSYSRHDKAFADELVRGLEYDGGFNVAIDTAELEGGEKWMERLKSLIHGSDTVVFVLSPASVKSQVCSTELDFALGLSKRIIPVQVSDLGGAAVPPVLSALNYVRFDEGRSFMSGLEELRRALKSDIDWVREHTRLLERAHDWLVENKADNRLLAGSDVKKAKDWLDRAPKQGLQPTELHRDFIHASDKAEALRLSVERDRANQLQKAVSRTRLALGGALLLAAVAGGLGLWAHQLRDVAEQRATEAKEASERARIEAERARAGEELAQKEKARAESALELAKRESERADKFVNLVSSNPAGHRAMEKICLEAIQVTATLATTTARGIYQESRERFWELYFAPMYIVELHQRKTSGHDVSNIESQMVRFGDRLRAIELIGEPLPYGDLCSYANSVRSGCVDYLKLDPAPAEACVPP